MIAAVLPSLRDCVSPQAAYKGSDVFLGKKTGMFGAGRSLGTRATNRLLRRKREIPREGRGQQAAGRKGHAKA